MWQTDMQALSAAIDGQRRGPRLGYRGMPTQAQGMPQRPPWGMQRPGMPPGMMRRGMRPGMAQGVMPQPPTSPVDAAPASPWLAQPPTAPGITPMDLGNGVTAYGYNPTMTPPTLPGWATTVPGMTTPPGFQGYRLPGA